LCITTVYIKRHPMKADLFFAQHPVFTRAEFAAYCEASGPCKQRAPGSSLAYHRRQGNLLRIRRGLYAVVPTGADPASVPLDAFLLATKMADDAVLAYHTALELHGVAYSMTQRLLYLTKHEDIKTTVFRSMTFRPVLVPKLLREKGEEDFGVTTVDRSGLDVRVTTLERTLVDVLDRPALGGGWEEVWRSLEAVSFFDLTQVVDYALLLGNATTVSKVGFFLEQHRDTLSVRDEHLQRLREHTPVGTHSLKRGSRALGVYLRDWNLVVPESVVHRTWEEPL
jgi:predicted transcriptional regulator of viral defense system